MLCLLYQTGAGAKLLRRVLGVPEGFISCDIIEDEEENGKKLGQVLHGWGDQLTGGQAEKGNSNEDPLSIFYHNGDYMFEHMAKNPKTKATLFIYYKNNKIAEIKDFASGDLEIILSLVKVKGEEGVAPPDGPVMALAYAMIDPIILDLDGDGVETVSLENGVYFDHDGNLFAEKTGWAGADDAFLVWDRNRNGLIDDGQFFAPQAA